MIAHHQTPHDDDTISGIPIRALSAKPSPSELGKIVAHWPSEKQAAFFIELGQALDNCCGQFRAQLQISAIAREIQSEEERLCDGHGSYVVKTLFGFLEGAA
jgi:hypothetical protein